MTVRHKFIVARIRETPNGIVLVCKSADKKSIQREFHVSDKTPDGRAFIEGADIGKSVISSLEIVP